ncbi:MAG TPA: RNA 2',3'-cyclic phosphodiesterase [Candidatus Omnitrophota bacterium]|nr:RNA 2',3'-cyclic phosphodiesterase [Candidatus Omnitrophota bacterium]
MWEHKGLFILTGQPARLFIAVDLTEEIRRELGALIGSLKRLGADVRWSPENNLHLTLKFLGDTPETRIGEIVEALGVIASGRAPFSASFGGLGAFPDTKNPRILWAGLVSGLTEMNDLALAVETRMFRLGFAKEERPFSPHLTLGRVRTSGNTASLSQVIENSGYRLDLQLVVDHVTLYQSVLTPGGSVYSALQRVDFK